MKRVYLGWCVLVDSPQWGKPGRVKKCSTQEEAKALARQLNRASAAPDRPLYFAEYFDSQSAVDHGRWKGKEPVAL